MYEHIGQDKDVVGIASLNFEGATLLHSEVLVLLQRGNVDGHNAVVALNASEFEASCRDPKAAVPTYGVMQWKLAKLEAYNAGLSSAATVDLTSFGIAGETLLFAASYEASDSASSNGVILGSLIGVTSAAAIPDVGLRASEVYEPSTALVHTASGEVFRGKIEGVGLLSASRMPNGNVELLVLSVTDPDGDESQYVHVKLEVEVEPSDAAPPRHGVRYGSESSDKPA